MVRMSLAWVFFFLTSFYSSQYSSRSGSKHFANNISFNSHRNPVRYSTSAICEILHFINENVEAQTELVQSDRAVESWSQDSNPGPIPGSMFINPLLALPKLLHIGILLGSFFV